MDLKCPKCGYKLYLWGSSSCWILECKKQDCNFSLSLCGNYEFFILGKFLNTLKIETIL
jgi:hypothetical protein